MSERLQKEIDDLIKRKNQDTIIRIRRSLKQMLEVHAYNTEELKRLIQLTTGESIASDTITAFIENYNRRDRTQPNSPSVKTLQVFINFLMEEKAISSLELLQKNEPLHQAAFSISEFFLVPSQAADSALCGSYTRQIIRGTRRVSRSTLSISLHTSQRFFVLIEETPDPNRQADSGSLWSQKYIKEGWLVPVEPHLYICGLRGIDSEERTIAIGLSLNDASEEKRLPLILFKDPAPLSRKAIQTLFAAQSASSDFIQAFQKDKKIDGRQGYENDNVTDNDADDWLASLSSQERRAIEKQAEALMSSAFSRKTRFEGAKELEKGVVMNDLLGEEAYYWLNEIDFGRVIELVKQGANVNYQSLQTGMTLLHCACALRAWNVVDAILETGKSDHLIRDKEGRLASHVVLGGQIDSHFDEYFERLSDLELEQGRAIGVIPRRTHNLPIEQHVRRLLKLGIDPEGTLGIKLKDLPDSQADNTPIDTEDKPGDLEP